MTARTVGRDHRHSRDSGVIGAFADSVVQTFRVKKTGVLVALLMAMLWQSVALARVGSTVNALADLQHASLHRQDEGHHHHDDGSYHLDDSDESARHLMADHSPASAILASASPAVAFLGGGSHGMREARAGPHPFLDGPLRPPRLTA
jgi:hypothetical protein